MDKGFNDDELADIMSEIESLEKEFSQDDQGSEMKVVETHEANEPVEASAETEAAHQEAPVAEEAHIQEEAHAGHTEETHAKDELHTTEAKGHVEEHTHSEAVAEVKEEMNEVLGELASMPAESIEPTQAKVEEVEMEQESTVHHISRSSTPQNAGQTSSARTSMDFHVEGDMKFELSFHIAGKYVALTVSEEGLEIGLDGGAKFTVPVEEAHLNHGKKAGKKAA